jgi:anti-sigma B factor antagonist
VRSPASWVRHALRLYERTAARVRSRTVSTSGDAPSTETNVAADSTLTVQVLYDGRVTRLIAAGEIDASSAHTFDAAATQALAELPASVEVDLGDIGFIDSSGLRSIISLSNRARERQIDVTITGMSAAARRVLEITGLIDTLRRS